MKILHVTFSCNRIRYLMPTIESWSKLDYGNHEVTRLIIDDYPRTRNDNIFQLLGKVHNTLLWMNTENLGLSVTWTNFFNWLKNQDYDYVLHQEDDVVLKHNISIDDMIECLESDPNMASVVLQRQPWYFHEEPCKIEFDDTPFKQYYYSKNTKTFPIIFSLYRKNITDNPFVDYWKFNLNEGMIMVYLNHFHNMFAANFKTPNGENFIEHIGEETTGKRILPGEPRYEFFEHMHPDKTYTSREGKLVE